MVAVLTHVVAVMVAEVVAVENAKGLDFPGFFCFGGSSGSKINFIYRFI